MARFRERLVEQVRATAGIMARVGSPPASARVLSTEQRTNYSVQTISFPSGTGIELQARLAVPNGSGRKPATLLLSVDPPLDSELERLAGSGNIVFAPMVLPGAGDADDRKSPLLGPFYMASLRSFLIGKTLVGLRAEDVLRAVDWLASRDDVDPSRISAEGRGPMGIVLLHAAVLDARVRSITLDRTLVSYRMAVDDPMPRDLAQSAIPGVLRHYDLDDLVMAIAPRPVLVIEPLDAAGKRVGNDEFHRQYDWVFDSDRILHQPDQLRVVELIKLITTSVD
ncbi:MAG: hypothetical protein WA476_01465 [Acidobacteriaceae bacterium]